MALTICKDCKGAVSKKAKVCPHCGAAQRRTSGCTWLVLLLLIALVALPLMSGQRPRSTSGTESIPHELATPDRSDKTRAVAFGNSSKADASVIPRAKRAVAAQLNNPDSAQFKEVSFAYSEATGNVAYGWVNSKNSLGAFAGYQRFVANEKTVLLEEREAERTLAAWREAMAGRMTERSLANLPDTASQVPVIFDVKTVIAKTPTEVRKILGKAAETNKSKLGTTLIYRSPDIEILFMGGKANLITINGLDSVAFSPAAIQALGLPMSDPTFANEQITMRWEPFSPTIKRVQINRGQKNCDFATVSVDGWPD